MQNDIYIKTVLTVYRSCNIDYRAESLDCADKS
jgi:hypothetical protein